MGVNHILLRDQLRDKLTGGLPLLLELFTALSGGSVNTKDKLVLLISLGEGEEGLVGIVEVASISEPCGLGDLIIE